MNQYVTAAEIKQGMPEGIRAETTVYDALLQRLAVRVSRMADAHCGRVFFPSVGTRYMDGDGSSRIYIPDLISLTALSYSWDEGANYTAYGAGDYILRVGEDYYPERSYTEILGNANAGGLGWFPSGQRSIKGVGVWGYAWDRSLCWGDSGDDVVDDPLSSGGTTITVADADGEDDWGIAPRFAAGQLLRLESEFCEVVKVNATTNTLTVMRAMNGSTAASHAKGTKIEVWRVAEEAKQGCMIQAVRLLQRGLQGYADARATPEVGELFYTRGIDQEARAYWDAVRRMDV